MLYVLVTKLMTYSPRLVMFLSISWKLIIYYKKIKINNNIINNKILNQEISQCNSQMLITQNM